MRPSHRSDGWRRPFYRVAAGEDLRGHYTKQFDVLFHDDMVMAFVSSAWWLANPGHVLVVSNAHHENVYAIPDTTLAGVQIASKWIAPALRATDDRHATPSRQHNEPGGDQEGWHYTRMSSRTTGGCTLCTHMRAPRRDPCGAGTNRPLC